MIIENTANNFLFIVIEGTSTWLEVGHDCCGLYIIFINLSCGLKQLVIKTTVPEMVMRGHAYHYKRGLQTRSVPEGHSEELLEKDGFCRSMVLNGLVKIRWTAKVKRKKKNSYTPFGEYNERKS